MLLFQQMLILFLLMLVGLICYKVKLITDDTCKTLSAVVLNVANPALILSSSMGTETKIRGIALATTLGIACALFAVLIAVAYLVPPLLRVDKGDAGVYRTMTIFSNIGFMGFPLVSAAYGKEAVLYAALFLLPFNLLIYTYGINAMKQLKAKKEKLRLGKVFNVGVISCFAALALYLFRLEPPVFISETVNHLSALSAPMSMMVIGASLATLNFKELITDIRLLAFSGVKLLVIPIVLMLIIRQFVAEEMLRGVCLVMLATPVASMSAMLAQQYGGNYMLTTKAIALTTVLSVVTIPIVSMIVL